MNRVELLLNGHPRALFIAARYFGLDAANSLVHYHHAATKGYLRANFYLGRHYEKAKQDNAKTLALRYYTVGAGGGDAACRCVRSRLFQLQTNVAKVLAKATLERIPRQIIKKSGQAEAPIRELADAASDACVNRDMDCPDPVYVRAATSIPVLQSLI
jgi:hypothetical protein